VLKYTKVEKESNIAIEMDKNHGGNPSNSFKLIRLVFGRCFFLAT